MIGKKRSQNASLRLGRQPSDRRILAYVLHISITDIAMSRHHSQTASADHFFRDLPYHVLQFLSSPLPRRAQVASLPLMSRS